MKRNWTEEELLTDFILLPNELHLSMMNKTEANRLGFALLLKYFQQEARFPHKKQDIPRVIIEYIAKQLDISPNRFEEYSWGGKEKTYTRHRKHIREFFGYRELTRADNERFKHWLIEHVSFTHDTDQLTTQGYSLFRKWKVEPPSTGSLKRMIDSAIDTFEKKLYQDTYHQLSSKTCSRIDVLLESHDHYRENKDDHNIMTFRQLLSSPSKPSVTTMEVELKKLLAIRHLHIPDDLFHHLPPKLITKYRLRAATETATELRVHPASIRYTLLAILFGSGANTLGGYTEAKRFLVESILCWNTE